ncbi:hypothetical protein THAOC_03916 [Thalassiosira oceanica]|uniref:Uncharacterized protein n=1 Tax=Thalassiosira oceanica TaxID=159749 RepID=K0TK83_THAOC|nr:hypothetical protein THAOC_03916 [Thalassiosira oceanica]|mmetsp:Transcript_1893/g.4170  ORF Transcript_1893/g.4170 Transcript_1893/m.4170 type:complete len:252 (+) Transcript_1893:89-844(+)|eukprot:EJK74411.1 hypothetical protein THAOC_03916 [Thalassiosira oceanica]
MKVSCALSVAAVGTASAYSVNRSTLRSLGQKSVGSVSNGGGQPRSRSNDMKMEDFGFLKGTGFGFEDLWDGDESISEVGLQNALAKEGLRYRLNKTPEEASQEEPLFGLPGFNVNLPLIGETYLGPPRVSSVWEAIGFTATSNNEARQNEKMKAIEKARTAKVGVRGTEGATQRAKWLEKYGYPRLVGSGGIFYADQLSTDKEPMGGFNMGKSGTIWPVPENVAKGQYGGSKGWGMKKNGPAVDGLDKVNM